MRLKLLLLGSLVLFSFSTHAQAAQIYKMEPGWSTIEFSVKNFGINTVEGRFKSFRGTIAYDDQDVTRSSVSVTLGVASIDTGIHKRDDHLQKAEFFNASQYPEIVFHSEHIIKSGDAFVLSGPLT